MTELTPNTLTVNARTCANCACFARMLADGSILDQGAAAPEKEPVWTVCRRNTPGAREVPTEVPSRLADARTGRPRMERATVLQVGYPFTLPTATCFDGWRPLDTLPGDRISASELERLASMARRLVADVMPPPPPPILSSRPEFYRDYDGT